MVRLLSLSILLFSSAALAGTYGLFEPAAIWDKKDVRVCWYNSPEQLVSREDIYTLHFTPLTQEQKSHYQQLTEKNYSPEKTGVHFVGWRDCSEKDEMSTSDAIIMANTGDLQSGFWGYSDLALGYEDSSTTSDGHYDKSFFSRIDQETRMSSKRVVRLALDRIAEVVTPLNNILNRSSSLLAEEVEVLRDATFIHELGHLAGMRHEHARTDRDLKLHSAFQFRLSEDQLSSATTYHTPYDHLSIMNYNHTGVVKSLFIAKYICTARVSARKYKLSFTKNECSQINSVIPKVAALSKYDDFTLQNAYTGKSTEKDFDLKTRNFIDQIVKKVSVSKLAPEQIVIEGQ